MDFGGFLTRFDLICTIVLPYLPKYWSGYSRLLID